MKSLKQEFVFDTNATVAECHAATVVVLNDKTVISAWFAGTAEGKEDVCIWFNRRVDGVWQSPKKLTENDGIPHWNPVLFSPDGESLTIFYKVGHKISDWKTYVMHSLDSGKTWSQAIELIVGDDSGGRGPVKNKPISVNGKILAPASVERGAWRGFIDVFDGENWHKSDIPPSDAAGVIQPTLWCDENGIVHAMLRSNNGFIYRSDSADFGESWSPCHPINMPNNNSGIDCVYTGGKLLLVCNPVSKNWGARSPLTVFISYDNGQSFERLFDLETIEGEFSYPSIVEKDDKIYIVYTYKRRKIAFCEFEL